MEAALEQLAKFLEPLLSVYAGKLGVVAQVITIVGSLRVFLKPVVSLARTYVDFTPSQKDNAALDKVLDSKAYKVASYVLDWFGSLKLPQKK